MINSEYGFGGMMTLDVGSQSQCLNGVNAITQLRYLAVSLGFYKTLFSAWEPLLRAKSLDEQAEMGLTDGLIRFSIGLDNDIEDIRNDESCMKELDIL
jgi:methionine-gamma-lyase